MSWRTLVIESRQHLTTKNNNLVIQAINNEVIKFSLDEIDSIIIDNFMSNISVPTILEITKRNICFIINNEKHDPAVLILPMSGHHKPLQNYEYQMQLLRRKKMIAQEQIIKQKIRNQRNVMEDFKALNVDLERMELYEKQVVQGDKKK